MNRQPTTADVDQLQQQIAATVARRIYADGVDGEVDPGALVRDLIPVIVAWAHEFAADELRAAAEECPTTLWYPWFIARADTLTTEQQPA